MVQGLVWNLEPLLVESSLVVSQPGIKAVRSAQCWVDQETEPVGLGWSLGHGGWSLSWFYYMGLVLKFKAEWRLFSLSFYHIGTLSVVYYLGLRGETWAMGKVLSFCVSSLISMLSEAATITYLFSLALVKIFSGMYSCLNWYFSEGVRVGMSYSIILLISLL